MAMAMCCFDGRIVARTAYEPGAAIGLEIGEAGLYSPGIVIPSVSWSSRRNYSRGATACVE